LAVLKFYYALTVTLHSALWLPSSVVTTTVVVPAVTAVTFPCTGVTVAIEVSFDLNE